MEWVKVGTVDQISSGGRRVVLVEEERVAIFNLEGEFLAIADTCSHAEASLSAGEREGYTVECPLHGAKFDLRTGRALSMPAVVGVTSYPVKVEGTNLLIGLEE
jgi:3-phenylpropionate/trans-cinnamate dioxygenase ferredoxin subunit